jgi:hypothetical protein
MLLNELFLPERARAVVRDVEVPIHTAVSPRTIARLVQRHDRGVRGMLTDEGKFLLWDATKGLHLDLERALGVQVHKWFVFYPTLESIEKETDWVHGEVYEGVDGAFFFTGFPLKEKDFQLPQLQGSKRIGYIKNGQIIFEDI